MDRISSDSFWSRNCDAVSPNHPKYQYESAFANQQSEEAIHVGLLSAFIAIPPCLLHMSYEQASTTVYPVLLANKDPYDGFIIPITRGTTTSINKQPSFFHCSQVSTSSLDGLAPHPPSAEVKMMTAPKWRNEHLEYKRIETKLEDV